MKQFLKNLQKIHCGAQANNIKSEKNNCVNNKTMFIKTKIKS